MSERSRLNAEERTIGPLPNMGRGERLENLKSRVRYERVVVNKDGLAWKYPVGTKKHGRWETVRDNKIHWGGVETTRSKNLDVNIGALETSLVKDTREIEAVDDGSRDFRYFGSGADRERDIALPDDTVLGTGCHDGVVGKGEWAAHRTSILLPKTRDDRDRTIRRVNM